MAAVDAALAERVTRWGALSVKKTEDAIDALVEEHDPGAVRRATQAASQETVQFGSPTDVAGTTTIWARLNSLDAALMEQTVEEVARSVCDADPRPIDHRRANALAAAVNHTAFGCHAGSPTAPAAPPAMRRPPTPWSTPWPTRKPSTPRQPPRNPHLRRRRHRARPLSRRAPRRSPPTCSVPGSCRPHYWAASWNARGSGRSATPAAARHRIRATPRQWRLASSCGAAI